MTPSPQSGLSAVADRARSLPWRSILLDLAVVAAWVGAVTAALAGTGLPSWLYALVALGGVAAYSLATDPWPDREAG